MHHQIVLLAYLKDLTIFEINNNVDNLISAFRLFS